MSPFENIVGAIHDLTYEEKLKLRTVLDDELKARETTSGNGVKPKSGLIGLFADEPELMDEVMESVYEHRSRPLRLDNEPRD
jgi:hypothetical protein